ncbi:hypothetical protein [Bacteriovorax sp. DB6_IX]|uniref:hypothetical protein n=1 Tax=Bacteriovorax sp. DB6_IX TaxID=1353530 RepID=UPI00038A1806|nr:hypothetical protein [Bacteriovorax sp. DB6_IX]EQC52584.1 hypothetical protein M901_1874 [Bacteriovorax sp. DB6_IX]
MKGIFTILLALVFISNANARVPRQKIHLVGNYDKSIKSSFKVDFLNKYKLKKIKIRDPYQDNNFYEFEGLSLADIFNYFGPKAKSLDVVAINLYKINFKRNHPRAKKTFFVFKENGKFINVDKMGPMRIVRDYQGIIKDTDLALEGVEWVWMIKELRFE